MKILLIEDDQPTGSALVETLAKHRYTVNWATDGETGMEMATAFEYDLLLLDIVIPKLNGIQVCQRLRSQGYQNPILLLTAKDSRDDLILGLDAGADDYIIKPFDMGELLARMRAIGRRGKVVTASVITWENVRFDSIHNEVICGDRLLHLTPKEYCLLELFLLNPKRIFSRRAILDRLWDFADSPGEETVSTHVKCLRQKFKAAGAPDPVETVHGLGYRLQPDSQSPAAQSPVAQSPAAQSPAAQSPVTQQQAPQFPSLQPQSLQPKSLQPESLQPLSLQSPSLQSAAVQSQMAQPHSQTAGANPSKEKARRKVAAQTMQVWQQSQEKFMAQTKVLEQAIAALAHDHLTPELHQQAQHEAHKLAGALGIFGLMEGSQIGKILEQWLQSETTLDPVQAGEMMAQVQRLQQLVADGPTSQPLVKTGEYLPLILLVDDDLLLAERVRIEAIAWGLRLEIATDLQLARKMIAQSAPDVLLLDLNFPGDEDGFTLLEELMHRVPKLPVLAFTGQGTLATRLEVTRLGGCVFLQKPLPSYEILSAITDVLHQTKIPHHNRVMVVDDDSVVREHLAALLRPLGLEVMGVGDLQQFWQKLNAWAPNLLILDLEMPQASGIELCQAIRCDRRWRDLPILFFSSHSENTALAQAFKAGADDYIGKTTPQEELTTRIIHRLRRSGFQNSFGLVGMGNCL